MGEGGGGGSQSELLGSSMEKLIPAEVRSGFFRVRNICYARSLRPHLPRIAPFYSTESFKPLRRKEPGTGA